MFADEASGRRQIPLAPDRGRDHPFVPPPEGGSFSLEQPMPKASAAQLSALLEGLEWTRVPAPLDAGDHLDTRSSRGLGFNTTVEISFKTMGAHGPELCPLARRSGRWPWSPAYTASSPGRRRVRPTASSKPSTGYSKPPNAGPGGGSTFKTIRTVVFLVAGNLKFSGINPHAP
jgi:hypothetical protein